MATDPKNEGALNTMLREVYDSVEPPDSWSALRSRIDGAVARGLTDGDRHKAFSKTVVFRLAVSAAAACLAVSLLAFSYVAGVKHGRSGYHAAQQNALDNHLFTEARLAQLVEAFTQVRRLFADERPWIMIGEGEHVQIGVNGESGADIDTGHVVVIRLAVNMEGQRAGRQYFDVVAFANQPAEVLLPVVSEAGVHVGVVPRLSGDGSIDIEIDASLNGNSRAQNTGRIARDSFTSLVRMRADGGWLSIDGTALAISGT